MGPTPGWLLLFLVHFTLHTLCSSELRQLHLIFRHGERTPADTYPTDPHINETFHPVGWGQLTNAGKRQQYEQGVWLRERYGDLLGDQYKAELIEAWTTDVDRTKMSMQLMMAGLMPPKGDQIWNKDLLWQPIPSSHQILAKDSLLLVRGCPRYSEALNALLEEPDIQAKISNNQELYEYLTLHTGRPVKNPDDVQDIYSTLKAEDDFKLKLPEWTASVYPQPMADVTAFSFVLNAYNKELQKIKGGPVLKKILKDTVDLKNGKTKKKLFAYAGHDSTISNVLMALQVWDEQIPVYNILIIFEIHEVDNDYGLKVFLRNTTDHEPFLLTIPGCQELCPLHQVVTLTEPIIPADIKETCKPQSSEYVPPAEGGP